MHKQNVYGESNSNVNVAYTKNLCGPLLRRVLLFGTMIDYGVYIARKSLNHYYDLGVVDQSQLYLKSVLCILCKLLFHFYYQWCSYLK